MAIAVFAAGAVGGYFGARLAEAGHEVVFIARGAHLEAIRERGLRVESVAGDVTIHPATATDDPASAGPMEFVIVAVKTWQLSEAAEAMRPLVGDRTTVVPLLNGVEAPDVLAGVLGSNHVLGGLCRIFARVVGPGHIRHTRHQPSLEFGELDDERSERVDHLATAFGRCTGVTVRIPPDITAAMWEKFLFVVPTGGVSAVTRAPIGTIRDIPETRAMLEAAMEEVRAVGRARGVRLDDDVVPGTMRFVDGLEPEGMPSMAQDILEGRPSELEAWNGAVVRLGLEAGVRTPVNGFIHASLLPQELQAARRPA